MVKITPANVGWAVSDGLTEYQAACSFMEDRARAIAAGEAGELVWLVEHPPVYTAGTSAQPKDLITSDRFPVYKTGRGGQYTYHGPGQRVAYVMLDVGARFGDVHAFVGTLEDWLIETLTAFNLRGERRAGRVGIWIARPERGAEREDKIAAIGVRLRRWVSFHGVSFNVDPELEHFSGIVPCGVLDQGVTSLADLGITATMADADIALKAAFTKVFGPVETVAPPLTRTQAA